MTENEPVTIWTIDGCESCEAARRRWPHAELRSLRDVIDGRDADTEVLAQFVFQDSAAPVVRVGARFLDWPELVAVCPGLAHPGDATTWLHYDPHTDCRPSPESEGR